MTEYGSLAVIYVLEMRCIRSVVCDTNHRYIARLPISNGINDRLMWIWSIAADHSQKLNEIPLNWRKLWLRCMIHRTTNENINHMLAILFNGRTIFVCQNHIHFGEFVWCWHWCTGEWQSTFRHSYFSFFYLSFLRFRLFLNRLQHTHTSSLRWQ